MQRGSVVEDDAESTVASCHAAQVAGLDAAIDRLARDAQLLGCLIDRDAYLVCLGWLAGGGRPHAHGAVLHSGCLGELGPREAGLARVE